MKAAYITQSSNSIILPHDQEVIEFKQLDSEKQALFMVFDGVKDLRFHAKNLLDMADYYEKNPNVTPETGHIYMIYPGKVFEPDQAKALLEQFVEHIKTT